MKSARFAFKCILISVALLSNWPYLLERFSEINSIPLMLMFVLLYSFFLLSILITATLSNHIVRCLCSIVFLFFFLFADAYWRVTGEFITYPSFISMVNAHGFLNEALEQYGDLFLVSALLGVSLFVGLALPLKKTVSNLFILLLPLASLTLLVVMLFVRGGYGGKGLSPVYTPMAYSILLLYEKMLSDDSPRLSVSIETEGVGKAKDVIYIIDESIRGDFLDINSDYGVFSGLKGESTRWQVYNYGLASAVATCSAEVNVTLRHGGTRDNYKAINDHYPSIWQYAKNAGMRTVYIDTQRTSGALQNYMDTEEVASIDEFIQFDDIAILNRDVLAAEKIAEYTQNSTSDFVLLNKMGAHFPVHDKYPDQYTFYKPALRRGVYVDISDTGSREGFDIDKERYLYLNSYKNTLVWSVGQFFSVLERKADFAKATLIYTADHGQYLSLDGGKGRSTHCNGERSTSEEAVVPLVVIEGASQTIKWGEHLSVNKNSVSHFNIFPTLLRLMGYQSSDVSKIYGYALDEKVKDPYTYNVRYNARLGLKPIWKKLEIESLNKPDS